MKLLLTGHDGYIGTVLAPILRDAGHAVVGLDNRWFEGCTFDNVRTAIPALERDVRDVRTADLEGFDALVHLAGLSHESFDHPRPELTQQINHRATLALAQKAKRAGVGRFLFASTCRVYPAAGARWLTEQTTPDPATPHAESKLRAEEDVSILADGRFSPTFLRLATVYGVSPRLRGDLIVNRLVGYAVTTGEIRLGGHGESWQPIVHVEDVSRAFLSVLQAPRDLVHDEIFNVGRTSENYPVEQIAEAIRQLVPGTRVRLTGDGPDDPGQCVNCDKIARVLGDFRPRWDLRQGIRQLVGSYLRHRPTRDELDSSRYWRAKCVSQLIRCGRLDAALRRPQPVWHSSRVA